MSAARRRAEARLRAHRTEVPRKRTGGGGGGAAATESLSHRSSYLSACEVPTWRRTCNCTSKYEHHQTRIARVFGTCGTKCRTARSTHSQICETSLIRYSSGLASSHRLDLLRPSSRRHSPGVTQEDPRTPHFHAPQQALTFPVLFGSPPEFRYVNMTSTSPVSAARNIFNAPTLGKEGDKEPRFPAPWELSLREIADGHRTGTFAEGANIIAQLCSIGSGRRVSRVSCVGISQKVNIGFAL